MILHVKYGTEFVIYARAEVAMKTLKEKLTEMLKAMTSAGAGEHEAAIRDLGHGGRGAGSVSSSAVQCDEAVPQGEPTLTGSFQDHMAAAAFAEAGEFDTALSMLQAKKRPRSVLLLIQGDSPLPEAFAHAVHLCRRLEADMQILAVSDSVGGKQTGENSAEEQSEYTAVTALARAAEEQGVSCSVFVSSGDVAHHLYHHVKQHKEVTTVIDGFPDKHVRGSRKTGVQRAVECIVEGLSIPLVRVWRKNPAKAHP
jgi:hypothetical protein